MPPETANPRTASSKVDIRDVEIIAPNFKRRLSGVTSTIIQLVPVQRALGYKIATLGPGLPDDLPHLRFRDLFRCWTPPQGRKFRIWHARRNVEMLPAIILRDVLRMPLKIVFTSAAQRRHTGWTRWLISRMDAVIATTGKSASYLDVKSTVSLHGIDTERFSPPADKATAKIERGLDPKMKIVGCFGRIRHQKGTDLFVETMVRLLPTRPDWMAVITGRTLSQHAAFENEMKAKIEAAGLSDRIRFVGEVESIPDWFRALDLFVAPQRWEGFGLTPLEAMATAVPVVATTVGAFPEILVTGENETGILVETGSVEAITNATAVLMDDDARRLAAGGNGRRHAVEEFSAEGEARRIGAVYQSLG